MTSPNTKADDGVHRLVDMVVEEVSLVDRAANKHRFLIVKRDDAMDDDKNDTPKTNASSSVASPAAKLDEDTPLGAALAALESLTALVELLGSLDAGEADAQIAELASELRAVAEQILARAGAPDDGSQGDTSAAVEARAKGAEPKKAGGTSTFPSDVAAAKQALSRLAELAGRSAPNAEKRGTAAAPAEPASPIAESLAKLAESFRSLSEMVKEQQQRLGRVEKQFGLPNSAAHAEHVSKASAEDVGWPLDLNKPKDRENVEKAVSFHDL